jgi:hypothetical protein
VTLYALAGVPLEIVARDERARAIVAERYAAFVVEGASPRLEIEVESATDEMLAESRALEEVEVERRSDGTLVVRRTDFIATFDGARRRASIRHLPYVAAVHSALRVVDAILLVLEGGVLLHASSVVDERGVARVFTGRSGAGKTTLARLAAPRLLLNDECSAVVPEGTHFRAHATPFWGEHRPDVEVRHDAELGGVFFPVKAAPGEASAKVRVRPAEAVRRILAGVFLFGHDPGLVERALDATTRLVASVPCWELRFRLDGSAWETIDGG